MVGILRLAVPSKDMYPKNPSDSVVSRILHPETEPWSKHSPSLVTNDRPIKSAHAILVDLVTP